MEITKDVKKNRSVGIGGSDCYNLMITQDWNTLYKLKVGDIDPPNLDKKFNVQLGIFTEPFNLHCLTQKLLTDNKRTNKGIHIDTSKKITYEPEPATKTIAISLTTSLLLYAHLDGYIDEHQCVIECKHTSENKTLADLTETYYPQVQHYINVTDSKQAIISGIFGNKSHMFDIIKRDDKYIEELETAQKAFWSYVLTKTEPDKNS